MIVNGITKCCTHGEGHMSWGDDDSPATSPADQAVQAQINENQAELEEQRKSLFSQRLAIIDTQGATNWNKTPNTPNNLPGNSRNPIPPFNGKPEGMGELVNAAVNKISGGLANQIGKQQTLS